MEIDGFMVGGVLFERPPTSEKEINHLLAKVANKIGENLGTDEDLYWFIIEQYDLFVSYESASQINFPFSMYDIEYKGRRSETSYVRKKNPCIEFLDTQYMEIMTAQYSKKQAEYGRGLMFALFCSAHEKEINKLRMRYAIHYHNNCVLNSSFNFAEEWNEVISSLGGD